MNQIDKCRFHSKNMANNYDQMCQILVPGYTLMQETLIDILKFVEIENIVLLDLGAGSGILIEKILKEFTDSICYYLDFSDDFMTIAKERLGKYQDRVTMEKFNNWKERNIDNINLPKKEGDDIHESFLMQLDWLNEIGFQETDIFCKYFLWNMIGGKKV